MLILKSLTFSAIGRFVEEQTVHFEALGPLTQVDAFNHNTSGSSGSGKSTIFKALEFLLGLNDVSNGILQSRLTKNHISVTGLFELDGIPLKIQRNKKLLIDIDGQEITGSSKLTEEKLDEIIGMSRDLFRKILHKRQGESGFFLEMGPSDIHKFLTNCLNLQKEQAKILTLDGRLNYLTDSESFLKNGIESNKTGLQASLLAMSALGSQPTLEIDPGAIETLKNEHDGISDTLKLVKDGQKKELESLEKDRPNSSTIPFDRSGIELIENEIKLSHSKISEYEGIELNRQSQIKDKIHKLQSEIYELENLENSKQNLVKLKISENERETLKLIHKVNEGSWAKEEAFKLADNLKKIRASSCPTCDQQWVSDSAKSEELSILKKLQAHKIKIIDGLEASKKIEELEKHTEEMKKELIILLSYDPSLSNKILISELKLNLTPIAIPEVLELKLQIDFKNKNLDILRQSERYHNAEENLRIKNMLSAFSHKQEALRLAQQSILSHLQKKQSEAYFKYNETKYKLDSFEEANKRYLSSASKLDLQMTNFKAILNSKTEELSKVQEEIDLATESKKVIKSYLSCSFEDALNSIGDTATRFIRNVPNLSTATIQLDGLKETKDGKVKEEINCVISVDGEIGIPIKSLSGGERSSLDLAVDLAVMEFIQERAGKGINLLILDEPFGGLDESNISSIIELLRESKINKQILIVDHNPIVKETFESKITVVRDGLTSKVVQQ